MRHRNACIVFLVLAISVIIIISSGLQVSFTSRGRLSREPLPPTNTYRFTTPSTVVGGVTEVGHQKQRNEERREAKSEITLTAVDDLSLLSSRKKHETEYSKNLRKEGDDEEEEKLEATAEEDSEVLYNSTIAKWQRFEEEEYNSNGNTSGNIVQSDANPFDDAEGGGGGGGVRGEGVIGKRSGSMINSSSVGRVPARRLGGNANRNTTKVIGDEPHTKLRGEQQGQDSSKLSAAYGGLRFLPWARVGPEFPHWQFLTNRVVGETRQRVMRSPLLCGDAMSEWAEQREGEPYSNMSSEFLNADDAYNYHSAGSSSSCEWYHVEAHPLRSPEGLSTAVFPSPYPSALAARGTYEELSRVGRVRGSRPHAPFEVYKEASRPSALGSAKLKHVLSALTESFVAQMRQKTAGGINAQMLVRKFGHLLSSSPNSSAAAAKAVMNRPTQQQLKALASKVGLSRVPYNGVAPQRQNQLSAWWVASGLQHDAKVVAYRASESRKREKEQQIVNTLTALHSSRSSNSTTSLVQLAATKARLELPRLFFTPRQTHILETVLSRTYLPYHSAVAGQLAPNQKNESLMRRSVRSLTRATSLATAVGSLYTLVEPSNTELFVRSAVKHRIIKFLLRVSAADMLEEARFHSRALTRVKALDPQFEERALLRLALPLRVPSPTELVALSAHSPMLLHLITNEMLMHHFDDRADETVGFVSYRAQQTPPIEGGTSSTAASSTRRTTRTASVWSRKKLSGQTFVKQPQHHVSSEGFYNLITQNELSAIASSIASSANPEASTNPLIYNPKQQQQGEPAGPPPRRSAGDPTLALATLPILESLEKERASRNMLLRYSLMEAALCSTVNCSEPKKIITHADVATSAAAAGDDNDDMLVRAARNVSALAAPFPFLARVAPEVHRLSAIGQMAVAMRNRLVRLSPSANPFFEPVLHDAMRSLEEYPPTAVDLGGGGRDLPFVAERVETTASAPPLKNTTANHNSKGSATNGCGDNSERTCNAHVEQPILGMLSHAPANVKSSHVDAVSGHWNYSRLPSWLVLPAVVNVANCLDPLVAKEHGRKEEKETQLGQGEDGKKGFVGTDGGSASKSERDSQKKRSILFLGSSHARNLFAAVCHQYVHSRELVGRGSWTKKADVLWPVDDACDHLNSNVSTHIRYGQRIHRMRDLDAVCAFDKREHRFGIVTRAQLMSTLPPDDPYRRAVTHSHVQRGSSQRGGAEGAQLIRDPDTSPFSLAFFMQPYAHWADLERVIELLVERLNTLEGAPDSRKESATPFFVGGDILNSSTSQQIGDAHETLRELATSLPRFVERVAAAVDLESPQKVKATPESHRRLSTPARFAYAEMFLRTKREDVERMRGLFTHVVFAPGVWESTFFDTTISEYAENIAVVLDLIDEVFAPQKIILYNIHTHHDAFDSLDPTGEQLKSAAASRPHNFEGFVGTKNGLGEEENGVRGGWAVPCAHRFRLAKFRDAHLCAATDAARQRVQNAWKREFEAAMRRPLNNDEEPQQFHQDDSSLAEDSWHPRAPVEIADMMPATSQSIAQLFVDNHGHHYSDVVLEAMSQRLLRDHICPPRYVAVRGNWGNKGGNHHSSHLSSTAEDVRSHARGPNYARSSLPSELLATNSSPLSYKKGAASVVGFLRVVTTPRSAHLMPRLEDVNKVRVNADVAAVSRHRKATPLTKRSMPPFVLGEIHDLFPLVKSPLPSVSAGLCRAIFDHPLAAVKPEVPSDRAVRPRRRASFKGLKDADEGGLIVKSTQKGSASKEADFSVGSFALTKYRALGTLSPFNPFSVCPVCSCLRVARLVLKATTGPPQNESISRNNKNANHSGRVPVASNPLLVIRNGEKEDAADRENAAKALRSVRAFYEHQMEKNEERVYSNNRYTCAYNVGNGGQSRLSVQDGPIVHPSNATKCDMAIISSKFPLRSIRHDENPFISVPLYASTRYTNDERYLLRSLLSETRWDSCAVEETDEKEREYLSRRFLLGSRLLASAANGVSFVTNSSTLQMGGSGSPASSEELVEEELELEEVSLCKGFRQKKLPCSTSVTEELRRRLHSFAYVRSMMLLIRIKSESESNTQQRG